MELEARMQRLEAEVEALRTRLDQMPAPPGSPGDRKAPAAPAPGEPPQAALMRSLAAQIREASHDLNGMEQPLILQAVVDRPGNAYISMSTMAELRERVDAAAIVKLAGVLASEARLTILRTLADGEHSAAEIGGAAGLEGGPLYHHLAELQEGCFLTQPSRGRYAMTRRGRDLYYQVALLVRTPYDAPLRGNGTTPPESP
jgi:DNA-binding transcriptional ArsR family regulator